jgi:hypothetical protein
MDKKALASLKKLSKNGRDLVGIISKYLDILEETLAEDSLALPAVKIVPAKKALAKTTSVKLVPAVKKVSGKAKEKAIVKPIAKVAAKPKAKILSKPAAKEAAKPAVKFDTKSVVKATETKVVAPVKQITIVPATPEEKKVAKRGRPAKEKKQ